MAFQQQLMVCSSLWGAAALPLPQPHPMLLYSSCTSSFPAGTFGREAAPDASPKVFWGVCFYKSSAMKPSPLRQGEEWRESSAPSCPAALHLVHEDPKDPKDRAPWELPVSHVAAQLKGDKNLFPALLEPCSINGAGHLCTPCCRVLPPTAQHPLSPKSSVAAHYPALVCDKWVLSTL